MHRLTTKYINRAEDCNCEARDITVEDLVNARTEITDITMEDMVNARSRITEHNHTNSLHS